LDYLILVRHSMPLIETDVPAREWHLSIEGRERCLPLSKDIAAYDPQVIVSSLESKAIETAAEVASQLNISALTANGLHEHERTLMPFLSRQAFEESVAAFFARPQELVLGDETADQAYDRFRSALKQVITTYTGKNLAVVTHGTVMTLFVSRQIGLEPFPLWKSLGMPAFIVFSLPDLHLVTVTEKIVDI